VLLIREEIKVDERLWGVRAPQAPQQGVHGTQEEGLPAVGQEDGRFAHKRRRVTALIALKH